MNTIIGIYLTKKEFAEYWGVNGSKNGSAWQKIERAIALLCDFDKVGKNRGIRYVIHDIYETPIKKTHGSLKYQLAKALSIVEIKKDSSKNQMLKRVGLQTTNMKHVDNLFVQIRFLELDPIDQLVFKIVDDIQLSLGRLIKNAIELLQEEKDFEHVKVYERMGVKTYKDEFKDSNEYNGFFELYKVAQEEAKDKVEREQGKDVYYKKKKKLVSAKYYDLIQSDIKYQPLYDFAIEFYFKKYRVINEEPSEEQITIVDSYIDKRKKWVAKSAREFHKKHIKDVSISSEKIVDIAMKIVDLLFENDNQKVFKAKYEQLMMEARSQQQTLEERVEDAMNFLPMC